MRIDPRAGIVDPNHPDIQQLPPRARATDPPTSHDAGEAHVATGRAQREQDVVLAALERHGRDGVTSDELAAAAGLDRYLVARRLPELRDVRGAARVYGYPLVPEKRRSMISGRKAMVWRPATTEPEQQALALDAAAGEASA